jgi:hypothetical protein
MSCVRKCVESEEGRELRSSNSRNREGEKARVRAAVVVESLVSRTDLACPKIVHLQPYFSPSIDSQGLNPMVTYKAQ